MTAEVLVSTYSQLSPFYRRAMCTGESVNTVRRLNLPPAAPLIPDATSAEQRHLEASFLLTWIDVADFAFNAERRLMPSFVAATHPAPDYLTISVSHPRYLLPLLRHALPRWVHNRLEGMPGLRAYPWRDYVELRLLGAENDVRARIRLLGVNQNRQQSRELLAKARSSTTCRPLHLERTITPGEIAWVTTPATRSDSLLSGLLRRLPLWRTADKVSFRITETAVNIRWTGGPNAATMLTVLGSPSCGIPHAGSCFSPFYNGHEITFSHERVYEHPVAEPWESWEAIHVAQKAGRNRDAVAPCSRAVVTPEAWDDQEMRNALATRDVSTVYKLLRRKGVSQRQIAAMTGQSQSEVSEILKGRQVMAYDVLVRIADGLGVPRGYMGFTYDEVTAARKAGTREAPEAEEPEEVKRRKFLAHAAAVALAAGTNRGSWVSNPVPRPAPGRIGMTDGELRKRLMAAIADLDGIGTGLWLRGESGEWRKGGKP